MFRRTLAAAVGLGAALACGAQTAATGGAATKYYRITFAITAGTSQPPQSVSIEVPVSAERSGVASLHLESGFAGEAIPRSLTVQCSGVHESAKGIGLKISVKSESEAPPRPGITEPIVQERVFERQVDLTLNTPTVVTEAAKQMVPLGSTNPHSAATSTQPRITVTATEL